MFNFKERIFILGGIVGMLIYITVDKIFSISQDNEDLKYENENIKNHIDNIYAEIKREENAGNTTK